MSNLNIFSGTSSNITNYNITAFAFKAITTAGALLLTGANTATDHIWNVSYLSVATGNAGVSFIQDTQTITFAEPLRLSTLKVPTITAGTAWVYLS